MFTQASQIVLGTLSRKAINETGNIRGSMALTRRILNTPVVLSRFRNLYPKAFEVMSASPHHMFVNFADDLNNNGYNFPTEHWYCAVAEDRVYGKGMQVSMTVTTDLEDEQLLKVIKHELRHIDDMLSGKLKLNLTTGIFTWMGVDYQAVPISDVVARESDCPLTKAVKLCNIAKYYAQPWEASANDGLWGDEFPGVEEMINEFGTTWPAGLDTDAVIQKMIDMDTGKLHVVAKALLTAEG